MQCKRCQLEKPEDKFPKRKLANGFGRRTICLICYREFNRPFANLSYRNNAEARKIKSKNYYEKNKETILKRNAAYFKTKRKNDLQFKISTNLRARLNSALRNQQKMGSAVADLGCSIDQLKKYLENYFKPGMSWDNWSRTGWHIDHVIPLANFDLTDSEQFKKAVHFSNLRPLWAKENHAKGKYSGT